MPSDNIKMGERESLEEAIRAGFAKPVGEAGGQQLATMPQAGMPTIVTAQKVAVERDEAKILGKIRVMAQGVGEDWFYRFPVKSKGQTNWIEGPSIKCANNVARMYGNCEIDTRIVDNGDSWIIYARFSDYETGFSYTRPFQQRKNQGSIRGDADRQLDIALQIGISKSIRNVICNALETFTNYAFEEAKSAIVGRVGKNLDAYRDRVIGRLTEMQVDLHRVEFTLGRASKDWLAPDVARIITQLQAINDGMATVDETWPPQEGAAPPRPTRDEFQDKPDVKTLEIFTITDFAGNETEVGGANTAADAYRAVLDAAERQGEAALGTAIDNNGPFFNQLDERGHTDLSRELSLEGGRRREAARAAAVPRGTNEPDATEATKTELRSAAAAERPGTGADNPPSQQPRQGEPSPAAPDAAPQSHSPAGAPSTQQERTTVGTDQQHAGPLNPNAPIQSPAGDLLSTPTERDPKFWGRSDGKRTVQTTDTDTFMGEFPRRLQEALSGAEVDDLEKHNAGMIRKLGMDDRAEAQQLLTQRREELRARG